MAGEIKDARLYLMNGEGKRKKEVADGEFPPVLFGELFKSIREYPQTRLFMVLFIERIFQKSVGGELKYNLEKISKIKKEDFLNDDSLMRKQIQKGVAQMKAAHKKAGIVTSWERDFAYAQKKAKSESKEDREFLQAQNEKALKKTDEERLSELLEVAITDTLKIIFDFLVRFAKPGIIKSSSPNDVSSYADSILKLLYGGENGYVLVNEENRISDEDVEVLKKTLSTMTKQLKTFRSRSIEKVRQKILSIQAMTGIESDSSKGEKFVAANFYLEGKISDGMVQSAFKIKEVEEKFADTEEIKLCFDLR